MNDTQKLTPELVSMAIESGILDDSLPALKEVLNARRDVLNARKAGSLNKGDQFNIKDCSPKKWNGVLVEFVKHEGIWLVCTVVADRNRTIRLRDCHVGTTYPKGTF